MAQIVDHEIRTRSGGTVLIKRLNRGKAIRAMCTECMGFGEEHPDKCTDRLCPLFPWRGKIMLGYDKLNEK